MIKTRYRSAFPGRNLAVGLLTLLIAGMSAYQGEWWGLLVLPVGLGIMSLYSGVLLDPEQRRVKPYFNLLGLKIGRWESYQRYPDLVVLSQRKRADRRIPFYFNVGMSFSHTDHELYLASPRHLDLLLVDVIHDADEADRRARTLAEDLGVNFMRYNPGRQRPPQSR